MIESIFVNLSITTIASIIIVYFIFNKANNFFDQLTNIFGKEADAYLIELQEISSQQFHKLAQKNKRNLEIIDKNSQIIQDLNQIVNTFGTKLYKLEKEIEAINKIVDSRKILENEVLKLKSILKRREKKR